MVLSGGMLDDGVVVDNLIRILSKDARGFNWFPSMDASAVNRIKLNELQIRAAQPSIDFLSHLDALTAKNRENDETQGLRKTNRVLEFDHEYLECSRLDQLFPSTEAVQSKITEVNLLISFHSKEGYNFSLEYSHVYHGKTDQTSAYEDTMIVCKRALLASDSQLSSDIERLDQIAGDYKMRSEVPRNFPIIFLSFLSYIRMLLTPKMSRVFHSENAMHTVPQNYKQRNSITVYKDMVCCCRDGQACVCRDSLITRCLTSTEQNNTILSIISINFQLLKGK